MAWRAKLELIVPRGRGDELVSALSAAQAKRIGDDKSFSHDAADAIGIHNDKRGEVAL